MEERLVARIEEELRAVVVALPRRHPLRSETIQPVAVLELLANLGDGVPDFHPALLEKVCKRAPPVGDASHIDIVAWLAEMMFDGGRKKEQSSSSRHSSGGVSSRGRTEAGGRGPRGVAGTTTSSGRGIGGTTGGGVERSSASKIGRTIGGAPLRTRSGSSGRVDRTGAEPTAVVSSSGSITGSMRGPARRQRSSSRGQRMNSGEPRDVLPDDFYGPLVQSGGISGTQSAHHQSRPQTAQARRTSPLTGPVDSSRTTTVSPWQQARPPTAPAAMERPPTRRGRSQERPDSARAAGPIVSALRSRSPAPLSSGQQDVGIDVLDLENRPRTEEPFFFRGQTGADHDTRLRSGSSPRAAQQTTSSYRGDITPAFPQTTPSQLPSQANSPDALSAGRLLLGDLGGGLGDGGLGGFLLGDEGSDLVQSTYTFADEDEMDSAGSPPALGGRGETGLSVKGTSIFARVVRRSEVGGRTHPAGGVSLPGSLSGAPRGAGGGGQYENLSGASSSTSRAVEVDQMGSRGGNKNAEGKNAAVSRAPVSPRSAAEVFFSRLAAHAAARSKDIGTLCLDHDGDLKGTLTITEAISLLVCVGMSQDRGMLKLLREVARSDPAGELRYPTWIGRVQGGGGGGAPSAAVGGAGAAPVVNHARPDDHVADLPEPACFLLRGEEQHFHHASTGVVSLAPRASTPGSSVGTVAVGAKEEKGSGDLHSFELDGFHELKSASLRSSTGSGSKIRSAEAEGADGSGLSITGLGVKSPTGGEVANVVALVPTSTGKEHSARHQHDYRSTGQQDHDNRPHEDRGPSEVEPYERAFAAASVLAGGGGAVVVPGAPVLFFPERETSKSSEDGGKKKFEGGSASDVPLSDSQKELVSSFSSNIVGALLKDRYGGRPGTDLLAALPVEQRNEIRAYCSGLVGAVIRDTEEKLGKKSAGDQHPPKGTKVVKISVDEPSVLHGEEMDDHHDHPETSEQVKFRKSTAAHVYDPNRDARESSYMPQEFYPPSPFYPPASHKGDKIYTSP